MTDEYLSELDRLLSEPTSCVRDRAMSTSTRSAEFPTGAE